MAEKFLPACFVGMALIAGVVSAMAAANPTNTYYWDVDGNASNTGATAYGGSGVWDASSAYWNTASNGTGILTTWPDTSTATANDRAVFGVSSSTQGGSVSLASDVYAHSLMFYTNGYTVGSVGSVIHLSANSSGSAVTLNNPGTSATISSQIDLTGGGTAWFNMNTANNGVLTLAGGLNSSAASATTMMFVTYNGIGTTVTGDITRSGTGAVNLAVGDGGTTPQATANAATVRLNGNNTGVTGAVTVNRGTLLLNNSNALGTSTGVVFSNLSSVAATGETSKVLIGTADVVIDRKITVNATTATDTSDVRVVGSNITSGAATYSGAVIIGDLQGLTKGLELTASTGGTTVFTNTISGTSTNSKVTINGGGNVKLMSSIGSTYAGGTTVTNGTLIVANTSGSATGTGALDVGVSGKLAGTGIISGATSISGMLTPGESGVGTLNIQNNVVFNDGSTWAVDLDNAGNTADLMSITGDLTLNGSVALTLSLLNTMPTVNSFVIASYSGTLTGTFSLINGLPSEYAIDYGTGLNSYITVVSVPEPAAWMMLLCGLMLVLGVSRARRIDARQ